MTRLQDSHKLARVWREVACCEDLSKLALRMLQLLGADLPASSLVLFRLEVERTSLRPAAWARVDSGSSTPAAHELADVQVFLEWCSSDKPRACSPGEAPAGLAPSRATTTRLCAALRAGERVLGMLELDLGSPRAGYESEVRWARELALPLSIAMANQERLRELALSKEVAEADRSRLLRRLGKDELGDTIIGATEGLKQVFERVQLVARTDTPVLLLGETGSGKEVVARALHEGSTLATHPFLRVNCGAIPPQLIDSELFGHERGSFTGAHQARLGWFERAHQGTLFLDEIAELPLEAQVRLLRVLQDGSFERVGGQTTIQVDVRIVAATHQDLALMVSAGSFRRDLWYRISVFPISIPPLRERLEDLPAMALHFAQRASRKLGLAFQAPTGDDIDALLSYDWPGNVREFAAVMERAVILGKGQRLEIGIALGLGAASRSADKPVQSSNARVQPRGRAELERPAVEAALASSRGRVEGPFGAALALGVAPHVLRSRLRRLQIDVRSFRDAH